MTESAKTEAPVETPAAPVIVEPAAAPKGESAQKSEKKGSGGFIFILLGLGGLGYYFYSKKKKQQRELEAANATREASMFPVL